MPDQSRGHGKSHPALVTLVRTEAAVHRLVLEQIGRLGEGLAADGADVRPNAAVHLAVLHHATGHGKRLSALGADERPLAHVRALVPEQRQRLVEGFTALCTREGLVVDVHVPLVLAQVRRADKVLAAGIADVWLLAGVGADVLAVVG